MTIKNSGNPLSYTEIAAEFGNPAGNKLGNYRVSENFGQLTNKPLDAGIPQGNSPIKFSQFYGKRANIVVDLYSNAVYGNGTNSGTNYNFDVYNDAFNANRYLVVGKKSGTDKNSVSKSQWQGGKKVIIHINKHFGSFGASNKNHAAIKMGNYNNNVNQSGWPSSTTFEIDIGTNGRVYGKGGNGGRGANSNNNAATAGAKGSSAMKIISGVQDDISGASRIIAGGGGGGGGAGAEQDDWTDKNSAGGGGGGGGRGYPAGSGGGGGSGRSNGGNGGNGSKNAGGNRGGKGSDAESQAGRGGAGGGSAAGPSDGGNGEDGNTGPTNNNQKPGGEGGTRYIFY